MKIKMDSYIVEVENSDGKNLKEIKNCVRDAIKQLKKCGCTEDTKVKDYPTYRGVEGTEFIDRGITNNPEIIYKDIVFNYYEVEDALWDDFKDYAKENKVDPLDEEEFNKFVKENCTNMLDLWIENKEPINDASNKLETPRGSFEISNSTYEELKKDGWGFWFDYMTPNDAIMREAEDWYKIMSKDNTAVAVLYKHLGNADVQKDSNVKDIDESTLINALQEAYGFNRLESLKWIRKATEEQKKAIVEGFKSNAKKSFGEDSKVKDAIIEKEVIVDRDDYFKTKEKLAPLGFKVGWTGEGKVQFIKYKDEDKLIVEDKTNEYIQNKLKEADEDEGREVALVFENNDGEMYNRLMPYLVEQYAKRVNKPNFDETQFKQLILNVVGQDALRLLKEVGEEDLWKNIGNRYYLAEWLLDSIIDMYEWDLANKEEEQ